MASMECAGEKPSTSIDAESYITTLKSFIDEQETKIKEKLDKLGWTREYIETNVSSVVQCPVDPGHWMPSASLPHHVEQCKERKSGVDFSGYDSPVDTSYCYRDKPNIVQVHVDDSCWSAIESGVAKQQPLRVPAGSSLSESPAVWLDPDYHHPPPPILLPTPGGGDGGGSELPSVMLKVVKSEGNEIKLAPEVQGDRIKSESDSTGVCGSVEGAERVPEEYDLVSRSVEARRVMYDNVIAAAKLISNPPSTGLSDKDLVRDDYKAAAKALKHEQSGSDSKSFHEKLAEERNKRRRRQKYRAKNIASNRSIKEIYRAVIEKRMAEYSALQLEEGELGSSNTNGRHQPGQSTLVSKHDGDREISGRGKTEHSRLDDTGSTRKLHTHDRTEGKHWNHSERKKSRKDEDDYQKRRKSRRSSGVESPPRDHDKHCHKKKHKKHKKRDHS